MIKLPEYLTKDELNKLLSGAKELRDKGWRPRLKKYNPRSRVINKYLIAIILQAYAGLRISEIFGLKPESSKCCNELLIEKRVQVGDKKLKRKYCVVCEKEWAADKYNRGHSLMGWDIEPLVPERIRNNQIFIKSGKGEKDRVVWKPRILTNKMIEELPLKLNGRSYQKFISRLSEKVLGRRISTHQLRHTFATLYLKANPGDLRGLQLLLGHSRLDTTSIYSHIAIDDLQERQAKVES